MLLTHLLHPGNLLIAGDERQSTLRVLRLRQLLEWTLQQGLLGAILVDCHSVVVGSILDVDDLVGVVAGDALVPLDDKTALTWRELRLGVGLLA